MSRRPDGASSLLKSLGEKPEKGNVQAIRLVNDRTKDPLRVCSLILATGKQWLRQDNKISGDKI